jgi:hypothetical protein
VIGDTTNAPVQDRSPDDYSSAFSAAGFKVFVRRFGYNDFLAAPADRSYYPSLVDAIDYQAKHKLLFRLVKSD